MADTSPDDVTQWLVAWSKGKPEALERLIPLVDAELRRLARGYLRRERPDHTLQTTALINEAYVRLIDSEHSDWQNRAHFIGIAAQTMRRVLVDHARRRRAQKRGGGAQTVTFDEALGNLGNCVDVVALHDAMESLEKLDPRLTRVVELRFFGGLNLEETGEVLGISVATVKRDWTTARTWLHKELEG